MRHRRLLHMCPYTYGAKKAYVYEPQKAYICPRRLTYVGPRRLSPYICVWAHIWAPELLYGHHKAYIYGPPLAIP